MVKKIIVDNRVYTEMEGTNICYIDGIITVYDLDTMTVKETYFYRNNSKYAEHNLDEWDAYWILSTIYNYKKEDLIEYAFPVNNILEILKEEIKRDPREIIEIDNTEYNTE